MIILIILITQALFYNAIANDIIVESPSLNDILLSIEEKSQNKAQEEYKNTNKFETNSEVICTKSFRSNFRKGPSVNFPILYEILIYGYPLKIIKYVDTWYAVEDFEGTIAWVSKINIKKKCGAIVKKQGLTSVYLHPSEESKIILSLQRGFIINTVECLTNEWCKINVKNTRGWIKKDNLWGNLNGY